MPKRKKWDREMVKKRRRELCTFMFRGIAMYRVKKLIAEKYDCTEETVMLDWKKRAQWLDTVFDVPIENPELLLMDILAEHQEIKRECWKLYHECPNENIKLGAMKQVMNVNHELLEMLQSVGAINKEPDPNFVVNLKQETIMVGGEGGDGRIQREIREYAAAFDEAMEKIGSSRDFGGNGAGELLNPPQAYS